jgi:hypothetical protein
MEPTRVPNDTPTQRRIRREAQAAARRAQALALREVGKSYRQIGQELGVCRERARQIVLRTRRREQNLHWSDCLSTRAQHLLRYLQEPINLLTLSETEAARAVAPYSRYELLMWPNFGKVACASIIDWLARHNLHLRVVDDNATIVLAKNLPLEPRETQKETAPSG